MADQFSTINGKKFVTGSITIPYRGTWAADIQLSDDVDITSSVTLVLANLTLVGSVFRTDKFGGTRWLRLVGGKGGWRKPVSKQAYYNVNGVKASTVLRDTASAVGERITIPQDKVLGQFFTRESATGERVLRQVLDGVWYVNNQGDTVAADRASGKINSDYQVINYEGGKGKLAISTEDVAAWMPGKTFQNFVLSKEQSIATTTIITGQDGKLRVEVLNNAG